MLPNFLIPGVTKGGTTSLYYYLRQHPEIWMPEVKELNYFSRNYDRGRDWYESHFAGCNGARAVGEASPSYIWYPEAPQRIASLVPDARLLFILRNPVERAYSHYLFDISRGVKASNQPFSSAIRSERGFRVYVTRGFYLDQIEGFTPRFPRDRTHFVLTEELKAEPMRVLQSCFAFLGVDARVEPDLRKHNVTYLPRSEMADRLNRFWGPIRRGTRPLTPAPIRKAFKPVWRQFHNSLLDSAPLPPMSSDDRQYLQEVFEPHNRRLSEFLGQDLDRVWK